MTYILTRTTGHFSFILTEYDPDGNVWDIYQFNLGDGVHKHLKKKWGLTDLEIPD